MFAVGRALLWLLVFVAWLALGLVLHANTPALRSAFSAALNRSLAGDFRGKVVLHGLDSIGVSGATLAEIQVLDERGELVLSLQGVRVRYGLASVARSFLLPGSGPLTVDHIRVESSRLVLVTDPQSGEWTLARALSKLKPPGPPGERPPLTYALSAVELGELTVLVAHPVLGKVEAHVHHVAGNAELGGEDTEVTVQRFGIRLVTGGDLTLDGTGSLRLLRKGFIAGTFHGFVDGTELDAGVQFDADVLSVRVDVPHALPERVRDAWPPWPISVPVAATLTARGPLDALDVSARVTGGESSLEIAGDVRLLTPARARLSANGHALDARLVWPGAPMTALEARAEIQVDPSATGALLLIDAETDATLIDTTPVPSAHVSLRIEAGETKAHYRLGDARAELEGDVIFVPGGAIQISARASRVNLGRFPELGGQARGRIELRAQAEIRDDKISGTLDAGLSGLALGQVSVASGRLDVTFGGSLGDLDTLDLRSSFTGTDIRLGPQRFERGHVTSRGAWQMSDFDAQLSGSDGASQGSARGKLDVREGLTLRDLDVSWSQPALTLAAHVSQWSPERGVLRAEEIKVSGKVGTLEGSAQIQPGRVELAATADGLDTKLLGRSIGIDTARLAGVVTGHGQLNTIAERAQGKLDLRVEGFGIFDLSLGELGVHASLADRQVEAKLEAVDSALGRLRADASLELAGPILDPAAWRGATGAGSAAVEQLPLWPIGLLLSQSGKLKELDGRADVALQVERKSRGSLPNVFVQAGTHELRFVLPGEHSGEPERAYENYTVNASASIDGGSGHGAATVVVTDEHGSLVTSSGSLDVDLPALLREPSAILTRLFATPLDALVRLHARPLSLLPPPFDVRDLAGSVEGTLQLRGSLAEPSLALAFSARQLLGSVADAGRAVDITSVVHYTPNTGKLLGHADVVQAGKTLVAARLTGSLPNPLETPPSWAVLELQAAAMLNGVPLELWPAAAREQLAARLYGSVDIEKHGLDVRQRAHLEIAALSARGHVLGNGRLTFDSRREQVRAELRIGSDEHHFRVRLRTASPGANEQGAPIEGSLAARDFDAAALSPLTSGILTHVGGSVNANLSFTLRPTAKDDWYLGINGQAELTNGSAHVDLLGLEVREIAAKLTSRSTPEYSVIQINPLQAKARSRAPNLRGDAELWLEGFRVVNGEANLSLADVPLSLKGASRGTARGSVKARLERQPDHMLLEIKIPTLRIKLPASSTRTLIALEANPEVNVLQAIPDEAEVAHDPLLWKFAFLLGDGVRLQRGDLDVPLTGQPIVEYQREVRPSGTIEALPGGHITLFDQVFSIDRGVVQFVPDEPDNPRIDITASWRAPDGTTVYVDITGSAQDASILTRDDRGLQEVERFYLITGSSGTINSGDSRVMADGGSSETGALGQTFALGINEVLRDALGNVAVSVGTTADDRPSYGASVRLTEKLSFQGSFQPASESNLEESNNDLTGTLDYRFSRRWSLRTELGTSGGAFDLLWSHRY